MQDEAPFPKSGPPKPPHGSLKRFYKDVSIVAVAEGSKYGINLDGKALRTPGRNILLLPTEALANAVAGEWRAQTDYILPQSMPLTRLANVAADAGDDLSHALLEGIALYAAHDLTCYLASEPEGLVQAQALAWAPLREWAESVLGARLVAVRGVMPAAQDSKSIEAIRAALEPYDAFALTALYNLTSLSGSVVIALAIAKGRLQPEEAFEAAALDEHFQAQIWGEDEEALARMRARWHDFLGAANFLSLLSAG